MHSAATQNGGLDPHGPTAELTWGETEYTQRQGNKVTFDESRCFALTSNDLFGGPLFIITLFSFFASKSESVTLVIVNSNMAAN